MDVPAALIPVAFRFNHGRLTVRLLMDGKYWEASEFEWHSLLGGATPEELGMFPFDGDDDVQD